MRRRFYYPVVLGAVVMISGCASMQLISIGASGLSYAMTGKSISDHAISTVMEQDCALHRVVMGDDPCMEYDGDGILRKAKPGKSDRRYVVRQNEAYWQDIPINHPPTNNPKVNEQPPSEYVNHKRLPQLSNPDETVKNLMVQKVSFKVDPDKVEVRTLQPIQNSYATITTMGQPAQPHLFAVLGSYNELHFAKQSLLKFTGLNAKVINNPARKTNPNATLYRVVAGPLSEAQFNTQLTAQHNAWRVKLCIETMLPPPCTKSVFAAMLNAR